MLKTLRITLLSGLFALTTGLVHADTKTVSVQKSVSIPDFQTTTLSLPQFDPSLGSLSQVALAFNFRATGNLSVTPDPVLGTDATFGIREIITAPGATLTAVAGRGTLPPGNTSFDLSGQDSKTTDDSIALASYRGTGVTSVGFVYDSELLHRIGGASGGGTSVTTLTATYTYTPSGSAVPEPGSLLYAIGLLPCAVALRRRRKI